MVIKQGKHTFAELAELLLFELCLRPSQGFIKSFIVKWFEQVIERVEFKCPNRILVVCRHKDDDRQLINGKRFEHPEAVQVGHLDVEENESRRVPPDRDHRLTAVRALANDREIISAAQQIADALPCQYFIINDQCLYGFHFTIRAKRLPQLTVGMESTALLPAPLRQRHLFLSDAPRRRVAAVGRVYWPARCPL